MNSMRQKTVTRQEVPDRKNGIVVGIDVSKGKINFAAYRPEWNTASTQVKQNKAGFEELKRFIEALQDSGHQVWVGFEPTGPYSICLREWLLANCYRTVQVNPYHSKRIKEVRDNSPLKSDDKDPGVIADLIWQGCYQELHELGGVYAELHSAIQDWKSCVKSKTAVGNEFQGELEKWFPELTSLFQKLLSKTILTLVKSYPSAKAIGRASRAEILSLIRKASRGKVSRQKADAVWQAAGESIAWHQGHIMRHQHLCRLIEQLEGLNNHLEILRKQMSALLAQIPQAECLLSTPGVGIITVASLLGMCGDLRRFKNYHQLEKFVGLNLFKLSSGKYEGNFHISKRGNEVVRCAMYQAATCQMKKGGLYYEYTQRQKEKRQRGQKIQIAIARKLLRVLYALFRYGVKFEGRRFRELGAGDDRRAIQGMPLKLAA